MDRKKIIEEGMLEEYLMGNLSPDQEAMVEDALARYKELGDQLRSLEADLEQIGLDNAIEPPPRVKERLSESLGVGSDKRSSVKKIDVRTNNTLQSGRLMVAASLAALFAAGAFWLYIQWQSSMDDIRLLEQQTADLRDRLQSLEQNYELTRDRYTVINHPQSIPLYLVGNQVSPDSRAVAYVNHQNKTVIVNGLGLVSLEPGKTYQMWADVEGEMIDMGVVPANEEYIPLRYIDKAESFNITIEPAGGSEHPTVENLISNVYL